MKILFITVFTLLSGAYCTNHYEYWFIGLCTAYINVFFAKWWD